MNTKDFKKLLKESISNGATYILDEQEEIPDSIAADEETQTQPEQDSEEASNKLADSLKKAAEEVAKFIQNKDLNAENLAKAMTYYFIGMYWDEPQNWEASVKSNSIFNRNLNIVLSNRLKDRTNIICLYSDLLEWLNKFYKSPEVLANKIERDVDGREVSKIKSALDANLKGSYRLTGNNSNILKQMIAYNKDYDITRCVPGEELEGGDKEAKEGDAEVIEIPSGRQSLEDFLKEINKFKVLKPYAFEIFQTLGIDLAFDKQKDLEEENKDKITLLKQIPETSKILKKIKSEKGKLAGQMAYLFIIRFLGRNKIGISPEVKQQFAALEVVPSKERSIDILSSVEKEKVNLEEQRYHMLLKRFNIK